jgi:hypothetical protein
MGAPPPAGRVGMDPWWAVVGGGGERPQVRKDGVAGSTKGWAGSAATAGQGWWTRRRWWWRSGNH